eukprot:2717929-Alexandrium_andersonii.AAC.1
MRRPWQQITPLPPGWAPRTGPHPARTTSRSSRHRCGRTTARVAAPSVPVTSRGAGTSSSL